MTQVKFYRVETLPEVGEVGSLYFVSGSENYGLWVYTGQFEPYTPQNYLEHVDVASELDKSVSVSEDTLLLNGDTAVVRNNVMKISPVFAEVEDDKLRIKL